MDGDTAKAGADRKMAILRPSRSGFSLKSVVILVTSAIFRNKRVRLTTAVALALTVAVKKLGVFPFTWFRGTGVVQFWKAFCASFSLIASLIYSSQLVETSNVSFEPTYFNIQLCRKARLRRKYLPCFWMANGHLMTTIGSLASDVEFFMYSSLEYESHEISSFDGFNTATLDWYIPAGQEAVAIENSQSQSSLFCTVWGDLQQRVI